MNLITKFYCLPLAESAVLILLFAMGWAWLTELFSPRVRRIAGFFAAAAGLTLIFCLTVLDRRGGLTEWHFLPGYWLLTYRENNEAFREMLMNVYLFLPFGLGLTCVWPARLTRGTCFGVSVGIILLLSVGIELYQGLTGAGVAETDDVIANALGGVIGMAIGRSPGLIRRHRK